MSEVAEYSRIATGADTDMEEMRGKDHNGREGGFDPPEAQNLIWEDDFFEDEEGVIAVFDFDYATMESFYVKAGWASMAFPPIFVMGLIGLVPCFLRKRVQWDVYSKHLAVTRDGIRFVREKRKTLCGCACTDAGRSSKTVPFDKITDCDIEEPGGNTCFCVKNVLTTVNIDTASSGQTQDGVRRHELVISGLKDPYNFKKLVWALKRSRGNTVSASSAVPFGYQPPDAAAVANTGVNNMELQKLLREIRDELREQTACLKQNIDR